MNAGAERPVLALRRPPGPRFLDEVERAWAAGYAVLPLAVDLPPAALRSVLATLRPALLDDATGGSEPLPDPLATGDDVALVVVTSGSTGAPKGVALTEAALRASADAALRRLGATAADRWLCCLPPTSMGGLQVLLRARRLGRAAAVHERFDPVAVAAEPDVTMVSLVPTMLRRALDAGADLSSLRAVLLGGGPAPPALLTRARAAGVPVVTTYGMTETCGGCVFDGVALDGVHVEVGAGGAIAIGGAVLFSGYHGRPDLTDAVLRDGVLRTADVGRFDAAGRLEVLGRSDDVIVTGGVNVAATEAAAIVAGHPRVVEAEVVGLPDERWGQRVVAVVVADAPAPGLAELRTFVTARATAPHAPHGLVVVDELPRLPTGKVDRLAVRRLAERHDR